MCGFIDCYCTRIALHSCTCSILLFRLLLTTMGSCMERSNSRKQPLASVFVVCNQHLFFSILSVIIPFFLSARPLLLFANEPLIKPYVAYPIAHIFFTESRCVKLTTMGRTRKITLYSRHLL